MSIPKSVLEKYNYNKTLIETGTGAGAGVQRALDAGFGTVHSIEAIQEFWFSARERFKKEYQVCIYLGESPMMLRNILLSHTRSITFVLDAHFTRCAGTPVPTPGISPCPVLEELDVIINHAKTYDLEHTILIDDRRLFKGNGHRIFKVPEQAIYDKIDASEMNPIVQYEDSHQAKDDVIVVRFKVPKLHEQFVPVKDMM